MEKPEITHPEFRQPDLDFKEKYQRAGNGTKENSTRRSKLLQGVCDN
jgi:hypothetical protein